MWLAASAASLATRLVTSSASMPRASRAFLRNTSSARASRPISSPRRSKGISRSRSPDATAPMASVIAPMGRTTRPVINRAANRPKAVATAISCKAVRKSRSARSASLAACSPIRSKAASATTMKLLRPATMARFSFARSIGGFRPAIRA